MYDYLGCECAVCHKLFTDGDDIVVCPDCGTPYHRSCYNETGHCVHTASHGAGFEWKPPQPPVHEVACTRCGAMNDEKNAYCASCGIPLHNNAGDAVRYGSAAEGERPRRSGPNDFDYQEMYHAAELGGLPGIDPNETLEGIPAAEWASYIGRASYRYLLAFKRMEIFNRKVVVSFSAMLWGHLYFFYRKAWKPAVWCLIVTLLLNTPAYLFMMKLTESTLTSGISYAALEVLMNAASVLLMAFRVVCGAYGFYLYKKDSVAKIQRIRQQYADPEKRAFVLSAQGGTSWAAVVLVLGATVIAGQLLSQLMGPNMDALYALLDL